MTNQVDTGHRTSQSNGVARVTGLYRYPVKGLTPQAMTSVDVCKGETFPLDRAWAIENAPGKFDPAAPRHLPKINFVMLMRDERLATLNARFEEPRATLTLSRDGRSLVSASLNSLEGRAKIEAVLEKDLAGSLRGKPTIVSAAGHTFSDVPAKCVHIVNLATVRALGEIIGSPVDPLRFRANIYVDGIAPWAEFNWLDQTVRIGDVDFEVWHRTERCAATNVDPATGARDMQIPDTLRRHAGHTDLGVYAHVAGDGRLCIGDGVHTANTVSSAILADRLRR